jgi:ankyrin repeat protein
MSLLLRTQEKVRPIHRAAMGGYTEILLTLIAHGADVNAADEVRGKNELHFSL